MVRIIQRLVIFVIAKIFETLQFLHRASSSKLFEKNSGSVFHNFETTKRQQIKKYIPYLNVRCVFPAVSR